MDFRAAVSGRINSRVILPQAISTICAPVAVARTPSLRVFVSDHSAMAIVRQGRPLTEMRVMVK